MMNSSNNNMFAVSSSDETIADHPWRSRRHKETKLVEGLSNVPIVEPFDCIVQVIDVVSINGETIMRVWDSDSLPSLKEGNLRRVLRIPPYTQLIPPDPLLLLSSNSHSIDIECCSYSMHTSHIPNLKSGDWIRIRGCRLEKSIRTNGSVEYSFRLHSGFDRNRRRIDKEYEISSPKISALKRRSDYTVNRLSNLRDELLSFPSPLNIDINSNSLSFPSTISSSLIHTSPNSISSPLIDLSDDSVFKRTNSVDRCSSSLPSFPTPITSRAAFLGLNTIDTTNDMIESTVESIDYRGIIRDRCEEDEEEEEVVYDTEEEEMNGSMDEEVCTDEERSKRNGWNERIRGGIMKNNNVVSNKSLYTTQSARSKKVRFNRKLHFNRIARETKKHLDPYKFKKPLFWSDSNTATGVTTDNNEVFDYV